MISNNYPSVKVLSSPSQQPIKDVFAQLRKYGFHQVTEFKNGEPVLVDLEESLNDFDIIYGSPRVSTDPQANTGYSKDVVQQLDCQHWAAMLDKPIQCHDVYKGESGRTANQPSLHEQLAKAKVHGRAAVMRWSLDRAIRPTIPGSTNYDPTQLAEIASYGVPVLIAMPIDSTPNQLRSRMAKLIYEFKNRRGEQYGQLPYFNREVVSLINGLRSVNRSYRRIAAELNEREIPSPKETQWSGKQVRATYLRFGNLTDAELSMYHAMRSVTEGLNMNM